MARPRLKAVPVPTPTTDLATVRTLVTGAWNCLKSSEPLEQRAALWRLVDAAGLLADGLEPALAANSVGLGRPTARGFRLGRVEVAPPELAPVAQLAPAANGTVNPTRKEKTDEGR
jgi:hypothetical protein